MAYYIYNSQLDAFTLYHQYREEATANQPSIGPALPALGHAISGAAGSAVSNIIIYPLNLVITRLQVQKQFRASQASNSSKEDDYKSIQDAVSKIYEQEGGMPAFYAGCVQDTAKTVADAFLFFLAYTFFRNSRQRVRGNSKRLPMSEELLIGMAAGAFGKLFTTPIQQIVTRKQTAAMLAARSDSGSVSPELSTRDIALQIIDEKGVKGFWSGYSATLVLTLNPSMTFLLHEFLLRTLVPKKRRERPGAALTFLIAAVSKAIASTITYPFSLAKSRAQVSGKGPGDPESESASFTDGDEKGKEAPSISARTRRQTVFETIIRIARTEGFWAMYQGLEGEVLKGFLQHGLTMLMKEQIHKAVIQLYYVILKALRRYPSAEKLAEMAKERSESVASEAKDVVQTTFEKGKEVLAGMASKGTETASHVASTTQESLSQSEEDFDLNKWLQGARDLLWGYVDDEEE